MIDLRHAGRGMCPLVAVVWFALGGPPGLADADELLVADRATSRIVAFDPATGAFTRVVSDSPLIDEPTGLALGPDGSLYVANLQSDVVKVDPLTGSASVFAAATAGAGGIAFSPSGALFVSEFGQFDGDDVFVHGADGTRLITYSTYPSLAPGLTGMAFDADGNLYVGAFKNDDFFSGAVLRFEATDSYASYTTFASGGLFGANGLAFDADGDLLVAGLIGQQIVKYDVDNGAVVGGAPFGGPIAYPSGITALDSGDFLVTSLGNDNPQDPIYGGFLFPGGIFRYAPDGARFSFLVGDFNSDLIVTDADLGVWSAAVGATAAADADGSGATDGADFLAWQRGLGNAGLLSASFQPTGVVLYLPAGEAAAVPEPASVALVGLAGLGIALYRRLTIVA